MTNASSWSCYHRTGLMAVNHLRVVILLPSVAKRRILPLSQWTGGNLLAAAGLYP